MSSDSKRTDLIRNGDNGHFLVKSTALKGLSKSANKLGYPLILIIAGLALISVIPIVYALDPPAPYLSTANGTSGVVNGSLYVNITQPVPFGDQTAGDDHNITVNFTLPAYSDIKWARLYEVWYSGSGTNNYGVRAITEMNGNMIGDEDMHTLSTPDGKLYYVNDHVRKIYSDYFIWYDVASNITNTTPSIYVHDGPVNDSNTYPYVDGRLKAIELVVAYNVTNASGNNTYYWVNQGPEWFFTTDKYPYFEEDSTTFDTSALYSQTASIANLTEMSTSSKEAFYNFTSNGTTKLTGGQPGSPYNYFNNNTWQKNTLDPFNGTLTGIQNTSTFKYHHSDQTGPYGAGSYQIQVATLSIKI